MSARPSPHLCWHCYGRVRARELPAGWQLLCLGNLEGSRLVAPVCSDPCAEALLAHCLKVPGVFLVGRRTTLARSA